MEKVSRTSCIHVYGQDTGEKKSKFMLKQKIGVDIYDYLHKS